MTKEKFDRTKSYENIQNIANTIYQNETKEEKIKRLKNLKNRLKAIPTTDDLKAKMIEIVEREEKTLKRK